MIRGGAGIGGLVAVTTALLACAAPAHARVTFTEDRVVLDAGDARAVVTADPVRITFTDRRGRTALRQVLAPRRPTRVPPTLDPEPFALEREPDRAVYAPLTFEVGRDRRAQWTGSYWAGNLLYDRHSGTVHHPTRLRSAQRAGAGMRLVMATTDRRRDLVVHIRPDRGAALRVLATPTSRRGVTWMGDSFDSRRREAFHGFGGRHWGTDQAGRKLYGWIEQENIGGPATLAAVPLLPGFVEEGTGRTLESLGFPRAQEIIDRLPGGPEHYLFPGGPGGAYTVHHQFVSSRPYGFLLNNPELSRWRMGSDRRDAWQVQAATDRLDYTVAVGSPARAMGTLSAITGRHRLPPAWSQGPIVWRANENTGRETAETYRAKIERDLADIARLRPPLSGYAFEGWGLLRDDAYVRDVIDRLHAMGIRAILYVRAFVADDPLRTQVAGDFEDVQRRGIVAKRADGSPFFFEVTGSPAVLLDFTSAGGRQWLRDRIHRMLDLGADGFMEDFGEQVIDGMRFADGSTGHELHNRYAVLYHRAGRQAVDEYEREHPGRETWFFARAGFSGRPGSQAYVAGEFPGDETIDWSAASGIKSLTPDMLNRAIGGSFGYTTDIGGYVDLLAGPTTPELFTRWSEWAALTPYFRVHNSPVNGTRMPWSFDEETYQRWVAMAELHQRAVPLIRRLWTEGRRTGVPPTRPLWLAFPGDRTAAHQDQQWMLGDDVLVAPVVDEGASGRRVYFPAGCWERPDTGERVRGPRDARISAPLGQLPFFFRCGTRPF